MAKFQGTGRRTGEAKFDTSLPSDFSRHLDTLGDSTSPQRTIKPSHKTGTVSRKAVRKAVRKVMAEGS